MEKEIWHSTKEATITTISGAPSANCNSLPVIKAISVTTGTVSEMVANTEPYDPADDPTPIESIPSDNPAQPVVTSLL